MDNSWAPYQWTSDYSELNPGVEFLEHVGSLESELTELLEIQHPSQIGHPPCLSAIVSPEAWESIVIPGSEAASFECLSAHIVAFL
jgi:hypothetical protein